MEKSRRVIPETEDETKKADSKISIKAMGRLAGYSFYIAWVIILFVSPLFSPYGLYSEAEAVMCRVGFLGGMAGILLVFWRCYQKTWLPACKGVVLPLCLCLLALVGASVVASAFVVRIVLWVVLGCLTVPFLALWATVYATLDYDKALPFISLSFFFGCVGAGILMFVQFFSPLITIILPVIALILYKKTKSDDEYGAVIAEETTSLSRDFHINWKLDCGIAAYSICLGFATFCGTLEEGWPYALAFPIGAACCGSLLVFADAKKNQVLTLSKLHRYFLFLVLVCVGPLLFLSTTALVIACTLAAFFFVFNLMINYSGHAIGMVVYGVPPVRYVCRAKMSNVVALGVGYLLAYGYHKVLYLPDQGWLVVRIGIVVAVLGFALVSLFGFTDMFPAAEVPLSETTSEHIRALCGQYSWTQRCESIAELYNFSSRQRDVLKYLSRGRNAPYIAETLFISESTVKSHIYSIYKKANVHSVQELIDKIEAVEGEDTVDGGVSSRASGG